MMSIGNKKFFLAVFIALFVPQVIFAATVTWPTFPYWGTGGLVSCTGNAYNQSAPLDSKNPTAGANTGKVCTSLCDIIHTIVNFAYFGMTIAVLLIAPILFAWGGIMMMLSAGEPGKMSQGKKIMTGTLIGILIVLGAFLIVYTFITVFGVGSFIQGFTGGLTCTA